MADAKITALAENTTPLGTDLLAIVDDPAGTPATQKITLQNMGIIDGWTPASETWTYASASTFTVAGVDVTAKYKKGTRLKWTQTTVKYGVVVNSTFSTNTTVTIAVNTNYTIANAAISLNYYSYQSNPQGYPNWFDWTTTWTGFSSAPNASMRYQIIGNTMWIDYQGAGGVGTSNATTMTFTIPVASLRTLYLWSWCRGYDNGTHLSTPCQLMASVSSATISAYKTNYQGAWTATGDKVITFGPICLEF